VVVSPCRLVALVVLPGDARRDVVALRRQAMVVGVAKGRFCAMFFLVGTLLS